MSASIMESLQWRYAAKKYDTQKTLTSQDWEVLKESLRLAPSAFGLQPWKFFVVHRANQEIRQKLKDASWGQGIIQECSHLIVFTTPKTVTAEHIEHFIDSTVAQRGVSPESLEGYKKMMEGHFLKSLPQEAHLGWAQRQAYIAMGFLLETAALLKIDSTPVEGLSASQYDEILGLKDQAVTTVAAVCLGYRHEEDTYQNYKKSRFTQSEIFIEL